MPFYQMQHSYPLSHPQKTSIAKAITKLHAYTFHAPSAFINVVFQDLTSAAHAAPSTNESVYFVGGEPTPEPQGPNRILAMVRVGSSRKKADFDTLAEEIETAWFDAVGQPRDQNEREAKRMQWIAFYPLVTARENGVVIPEAGAEATWLNNNMPYFRSRADEGSHMFKSIIEEVHQREDLKQYLD